MNKPLVSTYSFIEGIPVNIKAPLRINKGAVRAKFLSKLYFENSINLGTVDNGPITDLDWKTYLKTAALHVQSLSIAIQIKTDTFSANHKYLAHQVAVLYQSIPEGSSLAKFKPMIESNFSKVKELCAQASGEAETVQLPDELLEWLRTITSEILQEGVDTDEQLPKDLTHAWSKF